MNAVMAKEQADKLDLQQALIDARVAVYGELITWILNQETSLPGLFDYVHGQLELCMTETATLRTDAKTLSRQIAEALHVT